MYWMLMLACLQVTASDVAGRFTSIALGQEWTFTVERVALERTPLWLESQDVPPLAPRRAIAAARSELARHVADAQSWRLTGIRLVPLVGPGRWVYLIGLDEQPTLGVGPNPLNMVVLMDGTAVEPRLTPWRAGRP